MDAIAQNEKDQTAVETRPGECGHRCVRLATMRRPLHRLWAELRAPRDSGAISAAEFEIRKSAIWREI
jgi:hypothetical protein